MGYTITVSLKDTTNYKWVNYFTTSIDLFWFIAKAPLTVTANSNGSKNCTLTYGEDIPTYTVTYSGWVNGEDASVLTTAPTATSMYSTTTPVSNSWLEVSVGGGVAANYTFIDYYGGILVSKATVAVPTNAMAGSKVYTGATLTSDIAATEDYTVTTNAGGVNVGEYDVVLTLTDNANYKWKTGTDTATRMIKFNITTMTNTVTDVTLLGWTYGQTANNPTATSDKGTVEYKYYTNAGAFIGGTQPTNAGTYKVKAYVAADGNNYAEVYSANFTTFTVVKASIFEPTISNKRYIGSTQTATVATSDRYTVTTNNGGTDAGNYDLVLTLTDDGNYYWSTDITKQSATVTLTFTITQASNRFTTAVTITGWTYGDSANAPAATAAVGTSSYTYSASENGTYADVVPTAAGTYWVKAYVAETGNYQSAESKTSYAISKAKLEKPTDDTTVFTYSGSVQTYNPVDFASATMNINGNTQTNAVVDKDVTVSIKDTANYEWTDGTNADIVLQWTVNKATPITSIQTITATYGQTLSQATGLAAGYTLDQDGTGSVGMVATPASDLTATFTPTDTANYNMVTGVVVTLTVNKSTYDMSGVTFTDRMVVENGEAHSLAVVGLPSGVMAEYTNNGKTTAGVYTVTANFTGNVNYNDIADMTATLTINKAVVSGKTDENADKDDVIITRENGIDPTWTLVVTVVETEQNTDLADNLKQTLDKNDKIAKGYDVKLLLNNNPVQPNGYITVKILIPEELRNGSFKILHVHNTEVIEMTYTIDGDYAVITIDKLYEFVFVYDETSLLWLIILLAILLLAEIGLAAYKLYKDKKKKNEIKTYSFMPLLLAVFIPAGQLPAIITLAVLSALGGAFNAYLYLLKGKSGEATSIDAAEENAEDEATVEIADRDNKVAEDTPIVATETIMTPDIAEDSENEDEEET